jgi:hypothetical protein
MVQFSRHLEASMYQPWCHAVRASGNTDTVAVALNQMTAAAHKLAPKRVNKAKANYLWK